MSFSYPIPDEVSDSQTVLDEKIKKLIEMVHQSPRIMFFTGAGISTAASIPDYRGKHGLCTTQKPLVVLGLSEQKVLDFIMPTYSHMAIKTMIEAGKAHFVATSNHDGLHEKSGLSDEYISNIFGCVYVEKCLKCKTHYRRNVIVPTLGRVCDNSSCGGSLQKTGTRMGGQTPQKPLWIATQQAKKADLAIVLGSSMTISPFCELPSLAKKVVIVNLQPTTYDEEVDLKINSTCDEVMRRVISSLDLKIPQEFVYQQKYVLRGSLISDQKLSPTHSRQEWSIQITGDPHRPKEPPTCIEEISFRLPNNLYKEAEKLSNGMFQLSLVIDVRGLEEEEKKLKLIVNVKFQESLRSEEESFELVLNDEMEIERIFTKTCKI